MLRPIPPKRLRAYDPDRLLVGHGEGLFEDVGHSVRRAIDRARRTAVPMYLKNLKGLFGTR
jgi:hypothetical protein